MQIRPEEPRDRAAVFEVEKTAFGQAAEAELVDRLRNLGQLVLSLVAIQDAGIVGHVGFSPMTVSHSPEGLRALGLAPLAVAPAHQGQGIGGRLVEAGLSAATKEGWDLVFVLGHPGYYRRFGFEVACRHDLRWDGEAPPEAFMVKELTPGALAEVSGIARYHAAFDAV